MKAEENIKLATVGNLLDELKKYEKKHWELSVVAWTRNDYTFGVVGIGKDKDGDLRIEVEEVEEELEGIWSVADVITSLERYSKDARVYLAGHGVYFSIECEGSIFTKSEDDDVIGCYANPFSEYEPEPLRDRKKRGNPTETIVLVAIALAAVCWLGYNIYAMIAGVGGPLWEKILWIVASVIVLVVSGCTLYYSK